ncbi:alanyl-tRNA editing protein [Helicovermis profundi]|uniref:Alanyl-tRNA editing protein n=1 Tax=Helicovermis profundi TaxID=3065157 RepID=A0AAU9EAG1_9FIRM|nr:alanyl-tRNA editing protein [Clostridia bacterium S502]
MTIKLYENDMYLKEVDAKITEIIEEKNAIFLVLDKSIFFPLGGGQPSDIGYIENSKVLEVIEKNGKLYHRVEKKPIKDNVHLVLDWNRRLDNMQQHCGEHILSGIILKEINGHNKGFHMGKDIVTIDIDLPSIGGTLLKEIEKKANEAIYKNALVNIYNVNSKDEASKYGVRKEVTVEKDIRIVSIDGIDTVACCGSHPRRTGEVGLIKILKVEKNKNMTRIHFVCGNRALKDYKLKSDIISELSKKYSSSAENLLSKMAKKEEKNELIKQKYTELKNRFNSLEVETLFNENKNKYIKIYNDMDFNDIEYISKKVHEKIKCLTVFASANEKRILMIDGLDSNNCGKFFKENIRDFNGKGGGSINIAQGKFESEEDLRRFCEKADEILN